ncbi:hypothetical protein DPMN_177869 [Dreissena polymorpha]|uniref:Uncharacterized protein n=1 Tax=Dreissena polymorpha TaxID=45954 RepID=A0A9D4ECD7_DREPO|nr:hypothetical protein DPMN_177869 [Dreissena polymorpha]
MGHAELLRLEIIRLRTMLLRVPTGTMTGTPMSPQSNPHKARLQDKVKEALLPLQTRTSQSTTIYPIEDHIPVSPQP